MDIPVSFFNVSFNKAMAFGYKTDDVDDFVSRAIQYIRDLQEENETLLEKMGILAQNLEKYREEEDSLRSALVGAQKLGDSILKESRNKAEAILRDATNRADKVTMEAALELERKEYELNYVKNQTADFKDSLFALYRAHLDMLKQIPEDRTPAPRPAPPAAAPPPPLEEEPEPEPLQLPIQAYDDEGQQFFAPESYAPAYDDTPPDEDAQDDGYDDHPPAEIPQAPLYDDYADDAEQQPLDAFSISFENNYEVPEELVEAVAVAASIGDQPEDDTNYYIPKVSLARGTPPPREEDIFNPPPMVQMEFFDSAEDGEDDEFTEDTKQLRSVDMNRIPFFDDEDEDEDFEMHTPSPQGYKKPFVSTKFGEMKFGDGFKLTDD